MAAGSGAVTANVVDVRAERAFYGEVRWQDGVITAVREQSAVMALSFCALLVIPALKLSDRGLFDGAAMGFVPVAG